MGDERVVISVNKSYFYFFTLKVKDKYVRLLMCKKISALGVYLVPSSE